MLNIKRGFCLSFLFSIFVDMTIKFLSLLAGICYFILGIFVLIKKSFIITELEPNMAYILGTIIMVYGLFRIFRGIKMIKNKDENEV